MAEAGWIPDDVEFDFRLSQLTVSVFDALLKLGDFDLLLFKLFGLILDSPLQFRDLLLEYKVVAVDLMLRLDVFIFEIVLNFEAQVSDHESHLDLDHLPYEVQHVCWEAVHVVALHHVVNCVLDGAVNVTQEL